MNTKRVLIPVANGTEDIEAVAVIDILRRAGTDVTVASIEQETVVCANGTRLVADKKLAACINDEFDLIVLPGGDEGAAKMRDNADLVRMLKDQNQRGKLVAAICAAPAVVLAHHGIIGSKEATCYPTYVDGLGVQRRIEDRVVVDGNLITSRSPGTAIEFALKLVECLVGDNKARQIASGILAKT